MLFRSEKLPWRFRPELAARQLAADRTVRTHPPDASEGLAGLEVGMLADLFRQVIGVFDHLAIHVRHVERAFGPTRQIDRPEPIVARSQQFAVGDDGKPAPRSLAALLAARCKAILDHRRKIGGFQSRAALSEVPGMENRAKYVASFLTIEGGSEPLDRTMLQLEDYDLARAVATKKGMPVEQVFGCDLREQKPEDYTGPGIDRQRVIGVFIGLRDTGKDPRGVLTPPTPMLNQPGPSGQTTANLGLAMLTIGANHEFEIGRAHV